MVTVFATWSLSFYPMSYYHSDSHNYFVTMLEFIQYCNLMSSLFLSGIYQANTAMGTRQWSRDLNGALNMITLFKYDVIAIGMWSIVVCALCACTTQLLESPGCVFAVLYFVRKHVECVCVTTPALSVTPLFLYLLQTLTWWHIYHRSIQTTGDVPMAFRRSTLASNVPACRRYTYPHVPALIERDNGRKPWVGEGIAARISHSRQLVVPEVPAAPTPAPPAAPAAAESEPEDEEAEERGAGAAAAQPHERSSRRRTATPGSPSTAH